jgi:cysteine-rich repeat protein
MLCTYRSTRLALIGALFASACGGTDDPDPQPKPTDTVTISAFAANPGEVASGATTTLTWGVAATGSGTLSVVITAGATTIQPSTDQLTGTVVTPAISADTTYRLVATKGSVMAMRDITVTIDTNMPGVPQVTAFSATPMTGATRGGMVALNWSTSNSNKIDITEGATNLHTAMGAAAGSGTTMVSVPNETHVFKITATNGMGGSAERTITVTTVAPMIEAEPNDTAAMATPVTGGATGELTANDLDFYSITVPADGNVFAETSDGNTPCTTDTIVELYDTDGTTVITGSDDGAGIGTCSRIDPRTNPDAANLAAGTYYVVVSGATGTVTGNYTLSLVVGGPSCGNGIQEGTEQCDDGNTAGGDGCSAVCEVIFADTLSGPLPLDGTYSGVINPASDFDSYQVIMPAEGYITAETGVPTLGNCDGEDANDTIIVLLDQAGTEITRNDDDEDTEWLCSELNPGFDDLLHVQAGTYVVRVLSYQGQGGQVIPGYQIRIRGLGLGCGNTITEETEQCDDGNTATGDGCDATCNIEIAATINSPGGEAMVTVLPDDLTDPPFPKFIAVNVLEGQSLTATVTDGNGGCPFTNFLVLVDGEFTAQLAGRDGRGGCAYIDPRTDSGARELAAGLYHLAVGSSTTSSGGSLTVEVTLSDRECGNGILETGGATAELCDDGNANNGDTCTNMCTPPTTAINATRGGPVVTTQGSVAAGESDWYTITVPAGQTATLEATTYTTAGMPAAGCMAPDDSFVALYGPNNALIVSNDDVVAGGANLCSTLTGNAAAAGLAAGTYTLQVRQYYADRSMSYYLDVRLVP